MTCRNSICSTLALVLALGGCGSPGRDASGTGGRFGTEALGVTLGDVIYLAGVQSGRCLNVAGGSTAEGVALELRDCNGAASQQLRLETADGYYVLRVVGSDRCLAVSGASTSAGASIVQETCSGAASQEWSGTEVGGAYRITSRSSEMAIDAYGAGTANGTKIIQWPENGGSNQQWRVVAASDAVTCTVTIATSGSGTTSPAPGTYTVQAGTTGMVTATPASGYTFTGWSGSATGTANPLSVTVTGNMTLTASFAPATASYTLTIATSGSGTTSPAAGTHSYAAGTAVTVTATPASGYTFTGWGGAATGTTNPVTVTMDGNKALTATFTPSGGPTPTGFAATSSNGLSTTTGGGSATPITVTSCSSLKSYLEDGSARVLQIPSGTTLDCRTSPKTVQACQLQCSTGSSQVFWRVPVGDQTCTSLADFNGDGTLDVPPGTLVNKTRTDYIIKVNSNKTLSGLGSGGTLLGVSLDIESTSNVILRNIALREVNPSLIEAGDGLTINTSHHVWIDHCSFSNISDGYADIRYGSKAITLSYNHIDGRNAYVCGGQHNFVSLVSDSDVTFNNNYFDHVGGRNPKVTDVSRVHLYNNYYDSVSYFCASSGASSQLLVENNHYYNSRYPHWNEGGIIEASGNVYAGSTSTTGRGTNGDAFNPPYSYSKGSASALNGSVPAQAGIGKL